MCKNKNRLKDARTSVARVVNISEVVTRYEVGRVIFEVVQDGEERATYGKQLLKGVSEILTDHLGVGWSAETLRRCRKFFYLYSAKEISTTVLPKFKMLLIMRKNQQENTLSHSRGLTI